MISSLSDGSTSMILMGANLMMRSLLLLHAIQEYFAGYQSYEKAYKDRATFCAHGSCPEARLVRICPLCYNSSTFVMLQREEVL
jgi:hypothetical protein